MNLMDHVGDVVPVGNVADDGERGRRVVEQLVGAHAVGEERRLGVDVAPLRVVRGRADAQALSGDGGQNLVELQAQLAEARLSSLRTQLNPHFLFNTLNTVSALVERDPRGVRRMIARLSELLRYTMEGTGGQEVSLQEELRFLDGYLEIQRIRFQDRLEVEQDIAPNVLDALVPSLILQPLVENAIKHGLEPKLAGGEIKIRARLAEGDLVVEVIDNGAGFNPRAKDGVGLANIRERLKILYGGKAQLVIEVPPQGGTAVAIHVPYHLNEK